MFADFFYQRSNQKSLQPTHGLPFTTSTSTEEITARWNPEAWWEGNTSLRESEVGVVDERMKRTSSRGNKRLTEQIGAVLPSGFIWRKWNGTERTKVFIWSFSGWMISGQKWFPDSAAFARVRVKHSLLFMNLKVSLLSFSCPPHVSFIWFYMSHHFLTRGCQILITSLKPNIHPAASQNIQNNHLKSLPKICD